MRQRLHPSIFCLILKKISIDNTPKRVYNINMGGKRKISAKHWKGVKAVGKKKKHKKKPIKWQDLAIGALIDLIIGTILILIDKLLG